MTFDISAFSKSRRENSSFIEIWQQKRVLYMKTGIHFWSCLAQFFLEWEMFQTDVVEKIKTHIFCSLTFFRKSCRSWDIAEKHSRAGHATDTSRVHFTLDTKDTDRHLEYLTLIVFPRQQWLYERASALLYTRIACLVITYMLYVNCVVGGETL